MNINRRIRRVKTLFEHGQITNVTAISLLESKLSPGTAKYVFLHTILGL